MKNRFAADPLLALKGYLEWLTPMIFREVADWTILDANATPPPDYFRRCLSMLVQDRDSVVYSQIPTRPAVEETWNLWQRILDDRNQQSLVAPEDFAIDIGGYVKKMENAGDTRARINACTRASQPPHIYEKASDYLAAYMNRTFTLSWYKQDGHHLPSPSERKILNLVLHPVMSVLENALDLPTVATAHLEDMETRLYAALFKRHGWPSIVLSDIPKKAQLHVLHIIQSSP